MSSALLALLFSSTALADDGGGLLSYVTPATTDGSPELVCEALLRTSTGGTPIDVAPTACTDALWPVVREGLMRWRFDPVYRDGVPSRGRFIVHMAFPEGGGDAKLTVDLDPPTPDHPRRQPEDAKVKADSMPSAGEASGRCTARMLVESDGAPSDVQLRGACPESLHDNVRTAAMKLRFEPFVVDDTPRRFSVDRTWIVGTDTVTVQAPRLVPAVPKTKVAPNTPLVNAFYEHDGVCDARVGVSAAGKVTAVEMVECLEAFQPATKAALAKWTFQPAQVDGAAVASEAPIRIDFRIPPKDRSEADPHYAPISGWKTRVATSSPVKFPAAAKVDAHSCSLQVMVDEFGVPQDLRFETCDPVFSKATTDALMTWVWEPIQVRGTPGKAVIRATVDFDRNADDAALWVHPTEPSPDPGGIVPFAPAPVPTVELPPDFVAAAASLENGDYRCVVRVAVTKEGRAGQATILACPDALHAPALAAVDQWAWEPTTHEGKKITNVTDLPFTFTKTDDGGQSVTARCAAKVSVAASGKTDLLSVDGPSWCRVYVATVKHPAKSKQTAPVTCTVTKRWGPIDNGPVTVDSCDKKFKKYAVSAANTLGFHFPEEYAKVDFALELVFEAP
jgi:hypothetical protein